MQLYSEYYVSEKCERSVNKIGVLITKPNQKQTLFYPMAALIWQYVSGNL